MKGEEGSISVEIRADGLQRVKEQLSQVVDIRNVRGLGLFFGFGEEKPFNIPKREDLAPRTRKNIVFFATNYAISAALVGVVTILLNPVFLFVLICIGGFWLYGSSVASSDPNGTVVVFGRALTPEQRKMGQIAVSLGVIVLFGGSILFTICSASAALATAHAILRDCPIVRNEDELGFLDENAAKVANTV
ncbi:hypothetical protein P43SY_007172 [Pythium insidiosum]|uniref:PRA1 family protein n=1 Tax=Pythium insidiosum TaxID=114742 RepID=A0AAD5Q8B2_PYTIN|nr:hypothetical protein P43SY_007172 [Pythium insidiosum]